MISSSPWIRKLASFAALDDADRDLMDELTFEHQPFAASDSLGKSGERADRVAVILAGLGCVFKLLPDGRRQILAYLFPGDMSDPRQLLAPLWDHSSCVLGISRIALLTQVSIGRLERHPNILRAMSKYSLVRQAIAREWQVNVGSRSAIARVSHLLCEIHARLDVVGLTDGRNFELSLTQSELADSLALSSVHINRTLMVLRKAKIATVQNRHAVIHDMPALRTRGGFDGAYLRMDPEVDAPAIL
jgi:CRP-like cAMP-binding protein